MSTLAVNTITNAAGANTAQINGMTPTAQSLQGLRNRIINGDMRVDQRNAGASVTLAASAVFPVDRFFGFEDTDGTMTGQQDSSAPAGFTNSLKITTTVADASLAAAQFAFVRHNIEGTNFSDLGWGSANAQTVTLSFWTRSSLTGTFGGSVMNSAQNRVYPFSYAISAANTWEYKTITIPGDTTGTWLTSNGTGLQINFGLGVGSTYSGTAGAWAGAAVFAPTGAVSVIGTLSATFQITGVQLEAGSVATPFERRPYGQELALCQRYFRKTDATLYGEATIYGYTATGQSLGQSVPYPVAMRAAPTATYGGTWSRVNTTGGVIEPYQTSYFPYISAASTGALYQYPNNSGFVTFSAEL